MGVDYLTGAEQAMLERVPGGAFFVDEVTKGQNRRYAARLLSRLARKKKLVRLKKGQYFSAGRRNEGRFFMALALEPTGYIGLVSALSHYGLVDEALSRVQVCTRSKQGLRDLGGFDVELVALGDADFYGVVEEGALRFSTRAKTFFDCLKKPAFAGGIDRVIRTMKKAALSQDEWTELLYYLDAAPSKSLKQRAGFWLESLAPSWFLDGLEKSIGSKAVVRVGPAKWVSFNRRWGVYHGSTA